MGSGWGRCPAETTALLSPSPAGPVRPTSSWKDAPTVMPTRAPMSGSVVGSPARGPICNQVPFLGPPRMTSRLGESAPASWLGPRGAVFCWFWFQSLFRLIGRSGRSALNHSPGRAPSGLPSLPPDFLPPFPAPCRPQERPFLCPQGPRQKEEKTWEDTRGAPWPGPQVALSQVRALTLSLQGTRGGDVSGHLFLGVVWRVRTTGVADAAQ